MIIYALIGFAIIMGAAFLRRTADKYGDFCIAVSIPVFILLLLPIGAFTGWLRPATMDVAFRRADFGLGLDGLAFTRWLLRTGWYRVVGPIYDALPLVLALAWAVERSRTLLRASVISALMAFPLYLLFPAVGPQYVFPNFPVSDAATMPAAWMHPRNCFPSMHLTWAMLVALNFRNPKWRWLFVIYALLMAFAAVAGGEHYFIDVIAAVPFAFAAQRVAKTLPEFADLRQRVSGWAVSGKPSEQVLLRPDMDDHRISAGVPEKE